MVFLNIHRADFTCTALSQAANATLAPRSDELNPMASPLTQLGWTWPHIYILRGVLCVNTIRMHSRGTHVSTEPSLIPLQAKHPGSMLVYMHPQSRPNLGPDPDLGAEPPGAHISTHLLCPTIRCRGSYLSQRLSFRS